MTEMQMFKKGPEQMVEEIAKLSAEKDQPLRLRIQPTLLNPVDSTYRALPQVSWIMEIRDVAGVHALKDALGVFFECAVLQGPGEMLAYMKEVRAQLEKAK